MASGGQPHSSKKVSDSEWFPRGFALRYLMDQLRAVRSLNMPEADIRRIFRENALELLKLEG